MINFQNMQQLLTNFQNFKRTFTGNAEEQVKELMRSGRVSQAQYNNAVQMAQMFQGFLSSR